MNEVLDIYRPLQARVQEVIPESPSIKSFVLVPEREFTFRTGEFIELTIDGYGEAPFTPSSSPLVKDKIQVTVMKAGYVTEKIHALVPGDVVGIRGPFGRGYPLEEFYDKEVFILGGGCGFAPIRSLLYSLIAIRERLFRVILCYGAKTPGDCIYKPFVDELRKIDRFEVYRSVDKADDNWPERVGVVICLLDGPTIDIEKSVAVACGPPIMMKYGTLKLLCLGFPEDRIYLSMEKNMSCGLGKCGHCMMGKYYVCKDGPVFRYSEIKDQPDIWK